MSYYPLHHLHIPDDHSSRYWQFSTLLNFSTLRKICVSMWCDHKRIYNRLCSEGTLCIKEGLYTFFTLYLPLCLLISITQILKDVNIKSYIKVVVQMISIAEMIIRFHLEFKRRKIKKRKISKKTQKKQIKDFKTK